MLSDGLFVSSISVLFVIILLSRGIVDWSPSIIVVEGEVSYQRFVFLLTYSCFTLILPSLILLSEGQANIMHTCIDVSTIRDDSTFRDDL